MRIVAPMLSRMANFDDADPLRHEPAVDFRFVPPGQPLPRDADLVILFGSKSTVAELAFLRAEGWDHDLAAHVRAGGRVLGLCGGYQMLGRRIEDPDGSDGPPAAAEGLNLLDVTTRMRRSKAVATGQRPLRADACPGPRLRNPCRRNRGSGARPGRCLLIDGHGEGARSADGRIEGSYVHGLFASDEYRAGYLRRMGAASSALCYDESVQAALDALADGLESALDIERLFAAAGRTAVVKRFTVGAAALESPACNIGGMRGEGRHQGHRTASGCFHRDRFPCISQSGPRVRSDAHKVLAAADEVGYTPTALLQTCAPHVRATSSRSFRTSATASIPTSSRRSRRSRTAADIRYCSAIHSGSPRANTSSLR